jgi:hypothetical protein
MPLQRFHRGLLIGCPQHFGHDSIVGEQALHDPARTTALEFVEVRQPPP